MRYGFDSLFENFRNAIEQVLAEEYNGDLTNQKTYEVIKKYNQLSSYLKNIMNMKQLSDKDQEKIQVKFNELKDKMGNQIHISTVMLLDPALSKLLFHRHSTC